MERGDLADLAAFVAVADHRSFRAAASRLGVTPSALSHSMRQLEERLGMRLLHRTTRSVSVTDAGRRLLERLRPAIDQIAGALEDLNQERAAARGAAADLCQPFGASTVIVPIWGRFLSTYPDVHLELAVGEAPIDIVAQAFDAGIGPHDRVPADMIAVRVTGPMKFVVVGAPTYFARRRAAPHAGRSRPPQLRAISAAGDGDVFTWPFERNRKSRRIAVVGRVMVNDSRSRRSRGGRRARHRLTIEARGRAVPALGPAGPRAGRLVAVVRGTIPLLSWAPAGPGRAARLHRHDPHHPQHGAAQELIPEPVRRRLSAAGFFAGAVAPRSKRPARRNGVLAHLDASRGARTLPSPRRARTGASERVA